MGIFERHKEALISIAVKAKASPLREVCDYLRKHEPEIRHEEMLKCVQLLAETGITED